MMNFGHDRFGGSAKIHVCAAEEQKKLHRVKRKAETPHLTSRGCSSAGRAPALQAGGQEFDSPHLHQGCENSSNGRGSEREDLWPRDGLIAQLVRAHA